MKKLQLMLLAFCCSLLSVAQSSGDITLSVDMSTYGATFGTVYVSGNFNGWNGASNPLTDMGGGIWEATIPALGGGVIEYKFTIDDWAAQEALSPNSICTITTGGFTNRVHYIDGNASIPTVCWNECFACGAAAPVDGDITLTVDMSSSGATFTQMYISGAFNGWSGVDNAMTDNGDGTWTVTVTMPAGANEYKFTHDDWVGQESLAWYDSCFSNNEGNTNRIAYVNGNADLGSVCWNSCGACTGGVNGCTDATASNYNASATVDDGSCLYAMTFEVDMSAEIGFTTPAVESPLFGWCGGCAPMADQGGGIWSVTLDLPAGDFEYKYSVDNFAGQEELVDDVAAGCGWCAPITDGVSYANRLVTVAAGATQSDTYGECGPLPGGGCTDPTATNYEPCAAVDDGSCVYPGSVVLTVEDCSGTAVEVRMTGPFWGWDPAGGPLASDNGDGTWSVTLAPEVDMEYLWVMDGVQENLLDNSPQDLTCTPVTDGAAYANRLWTVGSGDVTGDVYDSCTSCGTGVTSGCTDSEAANYNASATSDDGSCVYDFTFTVDMSAESGFTTPAVESPNFGWCGGCAPMSDNGDGTWSTTLQLPAGAFEYKYAVDDFAGQEDLVDDVIAGNGFCAPITDGATFANREATIVANGSVSDIYGTCGIQTSEVTFNVDMSEYSGTEVFGFVNVSGEWNGWCGDCNQMTDNGDGTWSVTLPIPAGDYQYKYSINNWADQEDLVGAGSCVVTQGGNTNRTLTVETGVSQTLDLVCFASCYACQTGETPGCNNTNASNYDATATVNDGSCLFDVTFNLNTATAGLDFSTEVAHLFGSFNGWCGGCAPMNDDGDGTWSLTVELQEGYYEFKYAADATNTISETLDLILGSCVTENFGFTNRILQVTDDMDLDLVCWESCGDCVAGSGCTDATANNYDASATIDNGSCLYDVIFTVDMANYIAEGGTFTTPEVNGTFNGWCGGCAQMTNTVDDVWTLTIELGAGDYEYQFAVDNWADQEFGLDPAADCTIGANRALTVSGQTDIGLVCWESCSACETPVSVDVTFRVDMSNETVSPDGVHIAGSFQAWDAAASEMTYLGYGIYEITFVGLSGNQSYQYKYINGNTFASEEVIPAECNVSNNREVAIGDMNTVVDLVCFGECQACAGCTDPFSLEYNPFAGSDDGSCATAVVFGCTYADAENYDMAATSDDGSCTFAPAVSDCPEDLDGDLSIGTTDLLQVLAAFGSACP